MNIENIPVVKDKIEEDCIYLFIVISDTETANEKMVFRANKSFDCHDQLLNQFVNKEIANSGLQFVAVGGGWISFTRRDFGEVWFEGYNLLGKGKKNKEPARSIIREVYPDYKIHELYLAA